MNFSSFYFKQLKQRAQGSKCDAKRRDQEGNTKGKICKGRSQEKHCKSQLSLAPKSLDKCSHECKVTIES